MFKVATNNNRAMEILNSAFGRLLRGSHEPSLQAIGIDRKHQEPADWDLRWATLVAPE